MTIVSRTLAIVAAAAIGTFAWVPVRAQAGAPTPPPLLRFTVDSDGHPMAVWARRPAQPTGAVLLLHGRTWSSLPDFDLQVPGLQRSVMASLAARGLAAYAVDLRGYGETPRDGTGWLTPHRAAADVLNVLDWVAAEAPSLPPPALVGWSRGAAIAMLAAEAVPSKISALVVFGFAYDPAARFVDGVRPARPPRIRTTAEDARADFISPKVTPPAVVRAFTAEALRTDPVAADIAGDVELNAIVPATIVTPTLVLFGERDPGVRAEEAARMFARLGTTEKQMVVLPGADHAAQLEDTHDAWIAAVAGFVSREQGMVSRGQGAGGRGQAGTRGKG
jgi:pimeloyl-ACP methyl ester carboxylesterase